MKDFSIIATSLPINKTAKLVTQKGEGYNSTVKIQSGKYHSETPTMKIIKFIGDPKHDLSGYKYGRLTVIGYCGKAGKTRKQRQKKTGRWLVRCACGNYEIRHTTALNNIDNKNDCCVICRDNQYKREH